MNEDARLQPGGLAGLDHNMPELVAQLYSDASPPEKSRLLEHLVRPLNLLPLFALADGVFARIWMRNGREQLHIGVEDAQAVSGPDIAALVSYVQQSSVEVLDGLLQIINSSPVMAGSTAAILIMLVLQQTGKRRRRRTNQQTPGPSSFPR